MPVTHDDVRELLGSHEPPCLSIFLPTQQQGDLAQQDQLRLKNLLDRAERRLGELGLRPPRARDILAPGRALLDNGPFWQGGRSGLALFLSPGWHRIVETPFAVPERLTVNDRFHVRLLLRGGPDEEFAVLALSRRGARLFRGSRYRLRAVEVPDMPQGMAELERLLQPDKQLQRHSPGRQGAYQAGAIHGHGAGDEDDDDHVLEYLRQVDAAIRPHLRPREPLVLAGVARAQALYRQATSHGKVVEEAVLGNPDGLSAQELHARAWPLVERRLREATVVQLDRYRELASKGRATDRLDEIAGALQQGRVALLFVADDAVVWGTVRTGSADGVVRWHVHEAEQPGDEDLLDRAAAETLKTGGVVVPLPRAELPEGTPHAAIMRF